MKNDQFHFEIILGCMFSGKSTELIRRISRYQSIGMTVLCINHSLDTRAAGDTIKTHNHDTNLISALKTSALMSITETEAFTNADVIGVDESQFFKDLYQFVLFVEKCNKTLIISGLDGDYKREPIGDILKCIPLCDTVVKLTAFDMIDKDGSTAIFTKRISKPVGSADSIEPEEEEQISIGGSEKYLAVSRKNFHLVRFIKK